MQRIEIVKEIRKELWRTDTNWNLVEALCWVAHLHDTEFRDALHLKQKAKLLKDYLLDLRLHRKNPIDLRKLEILKIN